MLKKEARKLFREKRNALTAVERSKLDDLLLIQFQTVELPFVSNLLSYWPIESNKEPNTHLFSDYLDFKFPGLQSLYPQTDFASHEMKAIAVDETTAFEKNQYDIYEPVSGDIVDPAEIDMIFTPLLAFDKKGYRVGYGKGFYDRFLTHCSEECIIIGFSYFDPVDAIGDCDQFDVPLNLCITPQTVYVF